MNIFCFLWMPLFFLFWRALTNSNTAGGAWALILGSVTAIIQFFAGPLVKPGGFEVSRWLSGCIDIVALPAVAPVLVCLLLGNFGIIGGAEKPDFANFAFQWLIPTAVFRALGWVSLRDPVHLVLVPVLWTSIAAGVSFFIDLIREFTRIIVIIPSSLAILVIPLAAASSYWAFFSQDYPMGYLFLGIAVFPLLVSIAVSFFRGEAY
jgi:hypothetical protein